MSSHTSGGKLWRDAGGAALVEFAIVLPLFLIMSLGLVDLGIYFFHVNSATKATQVGARWAVVNAPVSSALQAALNDNSWWPVDALGKDCSAIGVTCQPSGSYLCKIGVSGCNMDAITAVMANVYPGLQASQVRVAYQPYTAGAGALGFVGRPG